jgi:hypothetical protein
MSQNSHKAPLAPATNILGGSKSNHKAYKPLRHEGRLGANISSDRKAYIMNSGNRSLASGGNNRLTGGNYKSISSIRTNSKGPAPKNLLKSRS